MACKHSAVEIKSTLGTIYLGSWIDSSLKDMNIRIQMAWSAAGKLEIRQSHLERNLERNFSKRTVESVLLYGSENWTLTKSMEKRLNGNYTRLLRKVLNVL